MKHDDHDAKFIREFRHTQSSERCPADVLPMPKAPRPVRRSPWFDRLYLLAAAVVGVFACGVLAGVAVWGYRIVTGVR